MNIDKWICRAIMSACGDADDCISTSEAADLAAKLDERVINNLPRPGEVEFINGGPPCQVPRASVLYFTAIISLSGSFKFM